MLSTATGYKTLLRELAGDRIDEEILEFMSGLLKEGLTDDLSSARVASLIGDFLLDANVCDSDDSLMKLCDKVFSVAHKSVVDGDSLGRQKGLKKSYIHSPITNQGVFVVRDFLNNAESGFSDPFLGIRDVNINFNSNIPLSESLMIEAQNQAKKEKQLKLMREWERSRAPLPGPLRKSGEGNMEKVLDVVVDSFSLSVGGRELLKDTSLKIVIGHRYGLIGRNGIGKSTLISAMVRHEIPGLSKDLRIGCVEQELSSELLKMTALDAVLRVDTERYELLRREKALLQQVPQTEDVGKELSYVYQRLQEIDADSSHAEAASLLSGLGFSLEMQNTLVERLSGGWRVRVALARGLFATPDILCLDEPTNHLDLHAVSWLTDFLLSSSITCVTVSHARSFLNDVCTDIIYFHSQRLKYYKGNYDTFEKVRTEEERLQQRQFEAQQLRRDHVQKFIDRFRYKAANAASVQSRIKALSKLPQLEAVSNDPTLCFKFYTPEDISTPVLVLDGVYFSYKDTVKEEEHETWILKDVNFSADLRSRIAICGVNGCGKSTFLKVLTGLFEPKRGFCKRSNKLRIGYFSQHHVERLDLILNAVQQLQAAYPKANLKDEDARAYLGRFGISGLLALEPLYILSGGQKSRIALALMAFTNPHIMVLDEPTNHLDLDAVQALIGAFTEFEGGLVIVSHDMYLLSCVVDEIYHVDANTHTMTQYKGTVDSYCQELLKKKN